MNIADLCHLLLDTDQLIIKQILIESDQISLAVESTSCTAICPACQAESREVHSTYMRYPIDLAWSDREVILKLKEKRFF
jgi:transposase